MFLSIGDGIAVIVRTHPLRFRGSVPERYAQNIQLGQELTLRIESVAEPRLAKVTRISPALDAQSRSLTIEALVDNSGDILRAGFFTEAEIVVDPNALAIVVPTSAVIDFAGNEKVWRVVDGMLTEQEVWTSNERDGLREVVNGLAVGDRILVKASQGRTAKLALLNESEATEPLASEGKR
jgi:RND family efflux transporter MFP subunit